MAVPISPAGQLEVDAVIAADRQRCRAIQDRDQTALAEVISDDLMYRHSTGLVEGKAAYIETSVGGTPRSVGRPGPLDIRIIGDVAIVHGDYTVRVEPSADAPQGHRLLAEGLQVWVKQDGQWQLLAHHGAVKG